MYSMTESCNKYRTLSFLLMARRIFVELISLWIHSFTMKILSLKKGERLTNWLKASLGEIDRMNMGMETVEPETRTGIKICRSLCIALYRSFSLLIRNWATNHTMVCSKRHTLVKSKRHTLVQNIIPYFVHHTLVYSRHHFRRCSDKDQFQHDWCRPSQTCQLSPQYRRSSIILRVKCNSVENWRSLE